MVVNHIIEVGSIQRSPAAFRAGNVPGHPLHGELIVAYAFQFNSSRILVFHMFCGTLGWHVGPHMGAGAERRGGV